MLAEPIRDRRRERREATKDEILQAAWAMARGGGLGAVSLRDIARSVGMQAPSLYSYFGSKNDIFDAMFAEGAQAFLDQARRLSDKGEPLAGLKLGMRFFVDFCTADVARYQLLFQRVIPGFEPSAESFAISTAGLGMVVDRLRRLGITLPEHLDLLTALGTGLVDQQISNDPGGDRWIRLLDEAVDMFYAHVMSAHSATNGSR